MRKMAFLTMLLFPILVWSIVPRALMPEIGPPICPLPGRAEDVLQLRLSLPDDGYLPELGPAAAWAFQAGHGALWRDWARGRTVAVGGGASLIDAGTVIDWVAFAEQATPAQITSRLDAIDGTRRNQNVHRSCSKVVEEDGRKRLVDTPCETDHNRNARRDILRFVVVPTMAIHGRWNEAVPLLAPGSGVGAGDDWMSRFLVSRGEFQKAIELSRRLRRDGEVDLLQLQPVVKGLAHAGRYDDMDRLLAEERALASPSRANSLFPLLARDVNRASEVHEALRSGDAVQAEEKADALSRRLNMSAEHSAAATAVLAYHLRRGNWPGAERLLEQAGSNRRLTFYHGGPHVGWLIAADHAFRSGDTGLAARFKAMANERFCATRPNSSYPKLGGLSPHVVEYLHLLLQMTAMQEGLIPRQPLVLPGY